MSTVMKPLPTRESKRREREVFGLAETIANEPNISTSDIQLRANGISASCRTSYYHYLNSAVEWGWIERVGVTRGAVYRPTAQFLHHVAIRNMQEPMTKRAKVGYNSKFLASYVPNETFYLTAEQRATLRSNCAVGSFKAHDDAVAPEVRRFMADLSHNSSAFEGVDIEYADTITFLEQNIESRHMSPMDAAILRNHYNAIRYIVDNTHYPPEDGDLLVSEFEIRSIHSILSDGLLKDSRKQGKLRYEYVEITNSCYIPTDQPDEIAAAFKQLSEKAAAIQDPYEQAMFLLVHIPYLQPFEDCNKRTARLVCNIPLLTKGILPISWSEVSQKDYTDCLLCVYEKNSVYGLCNLFVDACKRSFERFELTQKGRIPQRLEISMAKQISEAINNRILHGDYSLPRNVGPMQVVEFEAFIAYKLDQIRENDMAAVPYRIRPKAVSEWLLRESAMPTVQTPEEEKNDV